MSDAPAWPKYRYIGEPVLVFETTINGKHATARVDFPPPCRHPTSPDSSRARFVSSPKRWGGTPYPPVRKPPGLRL